MKSIQNHRFLKGQGANALSANARFSSVFSNGLSMYIIASHPAYSTLKSNSLQIKLATSSVSSFTRLLYSRFYSLPIPAWGLGS